MNPTHFEVGAFVIVGRAFGTDLIHGIASGEGTVVSITFVITKRRFQRPATSGVDITDKLEVQILVDTPIEATILKIEASVSRLTPCRNQDTVTLTFGVREDAERNAYRKRRLHQSEISRTSDNLIVWNDLGLAEIKLKVRMFLIAASGKGTRLDIDRVVLHLLDFRAMDITHSIFSKHLGDDTFLGLEVKSHRL